MSISFNSFKMDEFLSVEATDLEVKVEQVIELNNTQDFEIILKVQSGRYKNSMLKQRFFMGGEKDDWRLKVFLTRFPKLYDIVDGKKVIKSGITKYQLNGLTVILDYSRNKNNDFYSISNIRSIEEFMKKLQESEAVSKGLKPDAEVNDLPESNFPS